MHQKCMAPFGTPLIFLVYVCVFANCQLPREGGDSIHALFVHVAVLWGTLYTHSCVCVPLANCPAMGVIQSMLCSCLWQFFGVLCTHISCN